MTKPRSVLARTARKSRLWTWSQTKKAIAFRHLGVKQEQRKVWPIYACIRLTTLIGAGATKGNYSGPLQGFPILIKEGKKRRVFLVEYKTKPLQRKTLHGLYHIDAFATS